MHVQTVVFAFWVKNASTKLISICISPQIFAADHLLKAHLLASTSYLDAINSYKSSSFYCSFQAKNQRNGKSCQKNHCHPQCHVFNDLHPKSLQMEQRTAHKDDSKKFKPSFGHQCAKKPLHLCHKMKVWHLPDSIFGSLCWEDWENDKAEVTTSNRWHISKPIDSKIDANLIDCKSILASVTQVVQFKTCPVQHTASWVNQNMNTHWDIEHANPSFRHAHFSICDHHVTKMEVLISLQTVHHNHWHTTWCSILFLFCTTLVCLSFLVIPMRSAASKWCTPSFSHLCSISCLQWFQKMHNWFKQEMHLKTC